MSPIGIAQSLFKVVRSTSSANGKRDDLEGSDFSSMLALRMASTKADSLKVLLDSAFKNGQANDGAGGGLSALLGGAASATGVTASGRSLFDPASGYRLMSVVNAKDVAYKAQFAELSAMSDAVAGMKTAAQTLDDAEAAQDNATIGNYVASFVARYNDWIKRFDESVGANGVLQGTQAAEVALHELKESMRNVFNGAKDGFHGLKDLGVTIDPASRLAVFDAAKLEQALAGNRSGAVNTIDEFAANFATSAELLNSANNFLPNRLANLDRAIDYIDANKASLQREFGSGDAAQPAGGIARALAAYQQLVKA